MSGPRHLLRAWPELRRRLRKARRRALFTDYDGTLAPIRKSPEQARLGAGMRLALRDAAAASDVAGIVSGRRLEEVESLVGLPSIWYAAVHGFFLRSPAGKRYSLVGSKVRKQMACLRRSLLREMRGLKGIRVEGKGATVAVHYRRARRAAAERAKAIVGNHLHGGLQLMHGKKVWEFVPARGNRKVDKWTGISLILRRAGFRRGDHAAVVYLGDDVTDESVFRRLRGITVAVGKRQHTAARYYLRSPAEVRRFLRAWAEGSL